MRKRYRTYTKEFKEQAVSLAQEVGAAEASRQLGISGVNVHKWMNKKENNSNKKNQEVVDVPSESPEEEVKRLRKENEELKKANQILKSAAAFFSQDHLK